MRFKLLNKYVSFTPYASFENLFNLSEEEWNEWAKYSENGSIVETRLLMEGINAYVKANNLQKG